MACTNTNILKIFINVINAVLILVGIGLVVLAATFMRDIFIIIMAPICITIGSVGIYATLKDKVRLIYAYDIALLIITLAGLGMGITYLVSALSARGKGDSYALEKAIGPIMAGVTLGVTLLTLVATVITFILARNLSKSAANKSPENAKSLAG